MPEKSGKGRAKKVVDLAAGERPAPLTPKGRRSRARLIEAARKIFGRDGFHGTRITDIAEEAGVAHGTFYTYFTSKEEIFLALLEQLEGGLQGEPSPAATAGQGDSLFDQIRHRNYEYLRFYMESKEVMIVWEQLATLNDQVADLRYEATLRFVQRVERSIERMQKDGLLDPRIAPYYAAHALAGMVSRFAYSWALRDEPFDLDVAADQLTVLWTNSLGMTEQVAGAPS